MTGAPSKPLPAAPPGPDDDARVLTDGDTCDHARCPATAYVRVYMYANGDKDNLAGLLHFCGHHWHEVADTFWLLSIQTRCGIIDETTWLEAHS
jgi:hypothetical protein